jgi:lysophospholipase L1-like esterase
MFKALKKIALAVLGLVVGLVAAELLVRVVKPAPTVYPISVTSENGDHALSLNRTLIYVPKPDTGEFNAKGYRGREFPYERVPGKKRLVFIGDSVLEGLGVKSEERFTDLLAQRLGDGCEIINLGVRGYNLAQEAEYFKQFGLRYKPDAVLFCITYNDLDLAAGEIYGLKDALQAQGKESFFNAFYRKRGRLPGWLLKSHIFRHFYLIAAGRAKAAGAARKNFYESVYYRLTDEEINGILDDVIALGEKHRFLPVFVALPMPTQAKYLTALRDLVRSKNIGLIDLFEWARARYGEADRKAFFLDACHLNPAGHRAVADALAAEIPALLR